jgi:hypothetical protein
VHGLQLVGPLPYGGLDGELFLSEVDRSEAVVSARQDLAFNSSADEP